MKDWLVFLRSNPEAWSNFINHLKELGNKAMTEEHSAEEWADVKEARGKKMAYDYLLSLSGKSDRADEQYHIYLKAVKGK